MNWPKKIRGSFWVGLGYMLSPLSWWNDLFFNLPIAYGLAYGLTWWHRQWFIPATIAGYWFSNVLGLVMMQWGATDLFFGNRRSLESDQPHSRGGWQRQLWIALGSSTLYTLVILGLVYFHLLDLPDFLSSY